VRGVHNTELTVQWPACHRWLRVRPSSAWKRFNGYNSNRDNILTREELLNMPELTVNPFRERIATVFSSDGSGNMTFEDFLDFLSVFGSKARRGPRQTACGRTYRLTCVRTPFTVLVREPRRPRISSRRTPSASTVRMRGGAESSRCSRSTHTATTSPSPFVRCRHG